MPIIHIVLFEFKPTVTHAQVEDVILPTLRHEPTSTTRLTRPQVCQRMLALSSKCVHPTSQKPYVTSYGGGRDTSPEGLQVVHHLIPIDLDVELADTRL